MKKQLHQRVDTDYVKHILGKHLSQGFPVEECKRGKVTDTNRGVCQKITNNINMLTNSNWHFPSPTYEAASNTSSGCSCSLME